MRIRRTPMLLLPLTLALMAGAAAAQQPLSRPAASMPTSQPARQDPFARLAVLTPRSKLPPLRSVRSRDAKDNAQPTKDKEKDKVVVRIVTSPGRAAVVHGRSLLGTTPLTLTNKRGGTPLDVVIKAKGYMIVRTRIRRRVSRTYHFKLHPAKFR